MRRTLFSALPLYPRGSHSPVVLRNQGDGFSLGCTCRSETSECSGGSPLLGRAGCARSARRQRPGRQESGDRPGEERHPPSLFQAGSLHKSPPWGEAVSRTFCRSPFGSGRVRNPSRKVETRPAPPRCTRLTWRRGGPRSRKANSCGRSSPCTGNSSTTDPEEPEFAWRRHRPQPPFP